MQQLQASLKEIMMQRPLIAAMLAVLFGGMPVLAQVSGIGSPSPSIGATSPLGMVPGSPVLPTAIPMGSTELSSPGLSPLPAGPIGATGDDTACSAAGNLPLASSGSGTIYDGGGMAMVTGTSSPGSAATAGPCVPTSSGGAATSATTSPGGVAHAGIPLGSVEIDNGGISPLVIAPTPTLYSSTAGGGTPCSTVGSSLSLSGC